MRMRFSSWHPLKTSCCRWAMLGKIRSTASCACRLGGCSGSICASFCKDTRDSETWAPRRTRASDAWPGWSNSCRSCRSSYTDKFPSGNSSSSPCAYLENRKTWKRPVRKDQHVREHGGDSSKIVHSVRIEQGGSIPRPCLGSSWIRSFKSRHLDCLRERCTSHR